MLSCCGRHVVLIYDAMQMKIVMTAFFKSKAVIAVYLRIYIDTSSPWIWKGVSATLQSGRYTLLYPMGRCDRRVWMKYTFAC